MSFTTRMSLLVRVKAGDENAWFEFYNMYEKLIRRFGVRRHLTKDEIDDLVQNVMFELYRKDLIGKYDPDHIPDSAKKDDLSPGRFRFFLRGIVHRQALKIKYKRKDNVSLDTPEHQVFEPAIDDWGKIWDEEWKHLAVNLALEMLKSRVEPKTYQAFHMNAIQGRPVQEVATFLGMSKESVYQHKHRCLEILKKSIHSIEEL